MPKFEKIEFFLSHSTFDKILIFPDFQLWSKTLNILQHIYMDSLTIIESRMEVECLCGGASQPLDKTPKTR